jgi:FMN phosphatase YigB (HAD superfamily)
MDWIVSNEDVVKPKPNPEIYLKCITRLGLSPRETLIMEVAFDRYRSIYLLGFRYWSQGCTLVWSISLSNHRSTGFDLGKDHEIYTNGRTE